MNIVVSIFADLIENLGLWSFIWFKDLLKNLE